jgi:hypothetical protein
MAGDKNPAIFITSINMLMSIIEALLLFILGWFLGIRFLMPYVKEEYLKTSKADEPLRMSDVFLLNVELYKDIFYVYNEKTNSFVCQGSSLDEIFNMLPNRGINNAVVVCGDKRIYIKNGTLIGAFS